MTSSLVASLAAASDGRGSVPEVRIALVRLSNHLKNRAAHGSATSSDFFSEALDALSRIPGNGNSDLRLSCIFECASFFFNGGYPANAIRACDQLRSLASRSKTQFWLSKACNLSGLLLADAGDVANALCSHAEALEGWKLLGDIEGEIASLNNIGVAFNYAGLYSEAIPCFNRVTHIAEGVALSDLYVGRALCNSAQSYLFLGELTSARSAIDASLHLGQEPVDYEGALNRAIREFTAFQIAAEEGDFPSARRHAISCAHYGRWGNNSRCRAMVLIAEGLGEIYTGSPERGLKFVEESLVVSDVAAQRIDALCALVKACDQIGRPEEALGYLVRLLDHVRQVRRSSVDRMFALSLGPVPRRGGDGLRSLEHQEAKLRARVAERQIAASQLEMLERLAITADVKEESSGAHGHRVGRLASMFASGMGWPRDLCHALELAGRLHDIGKIGLPDRILLKSGGLRESERRFVSGHTLIGAEILTQGHSMALEMAREVAKFHHESWDGSGYPSGLASERIPISARIVALADVFDALTHGRPYAPAWEFERAIEEIEGRLGAQFDPLLGKQFLEFLKELRTRHSDLDSYLGHSAQNTAFTRARERIQLLVEGAERALAAEGERR